ncbi:uncharacterized protein METZ01_LOCUS497302, partial [marine metagenome]
MDMEPFFPCPVFVDRFLLPRGLQCSIQRLGRIRRTVWRLLCTYEHIAARYPMVMNVCALFTFDQGSVNYILVRQDVKDIA